MSMTVRRLEKSLLLKVEQRLAELLPDAEVRATRRSIRIRWKLLDCEIAVRALAEACIREDRGAWGAIAGGFCNLVAARVRAYFGRPISLKSELAAVLPILMADDPVEDALLQAAAPTPGLELTQFPWLDGFRLEFDYRGDGAQRRVFRRDLDSLGMTLEDVCGTALENLDMRSGELQFERFGEGEGEHVVLRCIRDGVAPALLAAEFGQRALLAALGAAGASASRALAMAPRSDRVYVCSMKSKAAMSRLCAYGWGDFETDNHDTLPLSPRLFTVTDEPQVRFLDHGAPIERYPEWRVTDLGPVRFAIPAGWHVSLQGDRWVIWTSNDGPRVRVRDLETKGGSPVAGFELADRVRQKQRAGRLERNEADVELGHGYFNGLAWTSVDTGAHDGIATASLFVVLPSTLVVLQTEVPAGAPPAEQIAMQRIISTIHAVPPLPPDEGEEGAGDL